MPQGVLLVKRICPSARYAGIWYGPGSIAAVRSGTVAPWVRTYAYDQTSVSRFSYSPPRIRWCKVTLRGLSPLLSIRNRVAGSDPRETGSAPSSPTSPSGRRNVQKFLGPFGTLNQAFLSFIPWEASPVAGRSLRSFLRLPHRCQGQAEQA